MRWTLRIVGCVVLGAAGFPVVVPANEVLVLQNATVHTMVGPAVVGGAIRIEGSRVSEVGLQVEIPVGAQQIDLEGQHVYPGLVNANTVLGLSEISSVLGTVDVAETGDLNPNARAEVAINPDSEIFPVTRANGVLAAMTAPRGGLVAGTAALVRLAGWTWEDLTIRAPVGLLVNWPDMRIDRSPDTETPVEEQIEKRDEKLQTLRRAFEDARAYQKAIEAEGRGTPKHDRDPRWEAMLPVLRREIPVLVVAPDLLRMRAALRWTEEENLRLVFISGADAAYLIEDLVRRDIPVILTPTYALPSRRWEPYDTPFTVAHKLHEAGVRFCFSLGASPFRAPNARNLPYEAGAAVAYGLPREEALRALTRYPAEILGAGDVLGTIEPGKEATLIVTDGDPLEIQTRVVRAFIAGRAVDLDNRHLRLYGKYRARPRPGQLPASEPSVTTR